MEEIINNFVNNITDIMGSLGIISGIVLIILESMIPVLPLGVFIALNVITFGEVVGFFISWISTIIGCMIAFSLSRKLGNKIFKKDKKTKNRELINKAKNKIGNMSLSNLVLILAVPFTPAFAVNIGAGLSNINPKKYLLALIIGKIPIVYFWGFIGKSLLESITDPYTIAQIIGMLVIAYLVSKLVNKFIGG